MGRMGISAQEVANVATNLQAQGKAPTIDNIREILKTGSKSTIARYLKDWKAIEGQVSQVKGLPQDLLSLVAGLWEQLEGRAQEQIDKIKTLSEQAIQENETKVELSEKTNKEYFAKITQLENALLEQVELNRQFQIQLTKEQLENSTCQEKICGLKNNLAFQIAENNKLHAMLKNHQLNLEHYQSNIQKLQFEQAMVLDKQKQRTDNELATLRAELNETINANHELMIHAAKLNHTLSSLEECKAENENLRKKVKTHDIAAITFEKNHQLLSQQKRELYRSFEKKSHELNKTQRKLAFCTHVQEQLKAGVAALNEKIHTLEQNNLCLIRDNAKLEAFFAQSQLNHSKLEI